MLDFAASLYLGLRHASHSLEPWDALTLGQPAALEEPPGAGSVAAELAALVGCEAGTLLPSTFHLFWDLLGVLRREPVEIFMDAATYPIARWGAEHWAGQGVPLRHFPAHDAQALARQLARGGRARPVVLCDGFSPGSISQPPLLDYAALARRHGGWLVIDDSQALGVFGRHPCTTAPYGSGGGGSLQRCGLRGAHMIVGASLAKGFGVPVALLAGSATLVQRFERDSASREHMSPPSVAVVKAARHALSVNRAAGDRLRGQLWRAVRRLRQRLRAIGLATQGDDFPVQTLHLATGTDVPALHAELLRRGVRTVLHRGRGASRARLSFLVRADHGNDPIDSAVAHLAQALTATRGPWARNETRSSPCMP